MWKRPTPATRDRTRPRNAAFASSTLRSDEDRLRVTFYHFLRRWDRPFPGSKTAAGWKSNDTDSHENTKPDLFAFSCFRGSSGFGGFEHDCDSAGEDLLRSARRGRKDDDRARHHDRRTDGIHESLNVQRRVGADGHRPERVADD